MKIQCLCMALCGCITLTAFAQEKSPSVVASAGDVSKSSNVVLEWTVGEPVIEAVASSSTLYTQGFHQPLLDVQRIKEVKGATMKYVVRVFPNPSSAIINVQLDKAAEKSLIISLLDVGGKVLLMKPLPQNSTAVQINVTGLSQGAYLLRITDAGGTLQGNYKIIKAQ